MGSEKVMGNDKFYLGDKLLISGTI